MKKPEKSFCFFHISLSLNCHGIFYLLLSITFAQAWEGCGTYADSHIQGPVSMTQWYTKPQPLLCQHLGSSWDSSRWAEVEELVGQDQSHDGRKRQKEVDWV